MYDTPMVRLTVKVRPGASRSEIAGLANGVWQIRVAAAPEKGKANQELTEFLSKQLGISRSHINIERGHTARVKLIAVEGLSIEDLNRLLDPKLPT